MTEINDLSHELQYRNPIPFQPLPGAYIYYDETPAHSFTTVVVPICNGTYCAVLPSRDFFDATLATSVLQFAIAHEYSISERVPLAVLDGFTFEGYGFDCVAVLSPSAGKQFEHENALLNARSFVVFPIYRCELSGDESADVVDLIRHDFLPSLDWKRAPCPKVRMAFVNRRTKIRSNRPQLQLAKMENVRTEIRNLEEAGDSWILIENFLGVTVRISWEDGRYVLERDGARAIKADRSAIDELVEATVLRGKAHCFDCP